MSHALQTKTFNPNHWPMKLDVPEGLTYIDTDERSEMISALQNGLGVFTSSCGGHVFLWKDAADLFHANHFFQGAPIHKTFVTIDSVVDFATGCNI
jgi:hypothetical protein